MGRSIGVEGTETESYSELTEWPCLITHKRDTTGNFISTCLCLADWAVFLKPLEKTEDLFG